MALRLVRQDKDKSPVDKASPPRDGRGRGRSTFRKRDLQTALNAARKAGLAIVRFEIDRDGRIVIVVGKTDTGTDLDRELAEFEAKHAR
jgi:hypothetical protein